MISTNLAQMWCTVMIQIVFSPVSSFANGHALGCVVADAIVVLIGSNTSKVLCD